MRQRPDNTRLHDWLDETVGQTPDPVEATRQVMSQIEETSQVGRWLPFPVLHRKPKAQKPTATNTTEYQPSPTPAMNGRTPTVIGRTQSMLSPTKAITAGALVFAIGGVMLIAQPFGQQIAVTPGAEAEFAPPVEVTGTLGIGGCSRTRQEGDETTLPGSDDQYTCTATWSMSDDRLSGTATLINENYYLVGGGLEASETLSSACAEDPECEIPDLETFSSAMSVENDDGVWRQRPSVRLWYPGATDPDRTVLVMDGEQGYEGLVAVLEATGQEDDTTYFGFILDARQVKAAPENASTR